MWQESSFHEKKKKIPWTLTKEGPTREVKNGHESPKAQKEGKKIYKKGKKKKEEDPNLGQEANHLIENLKILRRMQTT